MRDGIDRANPTRRAVLIGATVLIAAAASSPRLQAIGTLRPIGAGLFLDAFGAVTTMPVAPRFEQNR